MKKEEWRERIKTSMKKAGTYKDFFDDVVDALSIILENRDHAQELFEKSGGNILVNHTNKGGATNIEQNPAMRLINELNKDALAYWRDLGLTPNGLKKLNDSALKESNIKISALTDALNKIGG